MGYIFLLFFVGGGVYSNGSEYAIWLNAADKGALYNGHQSSIKSVAWSPQSKHVVSAGAGPIDASIKIWDIEAGRALITVKSGKGVARSLLWSSNGQKLAALYSRYPFVRVFDPRSGETIRQLKEHYGNAATAAWTPDSSELYVTSWDGQVTRWDVRRDPDITSSLSHWNSLGDQQIWSYALCTALNKVYLAYATKPSCCSSTAIKVYDAAQDKHVHSLKRQWGDSAGVYELAWSNDGSYLTALYSELREREVRVWEPGKKLSCNMLNPQSITSFKESGALHWSPRGTFLAASLSNAVNIWSSKKGLHLVHVYGFGNISSMDWSPDESYIVVGRKDRGIHFVPVKESIDTATNGCTSCLKKSSVVCKAFLCCRCKVRYQ